MVNTKRVYISVLVLSAVALYLYTVIEFIGIKGMTAGINYLIMLLLVLGYNYLVFRNGPFYKPFNKIIYMMVNLMPLFINMLGVIVNNVNGEKDYVISITKYIYASMPLYILMCALFGYYIWLMIKKKDLV